MDAHGCAVFPSPGDESMTQEHKDENQRRRQDPQRPNIAPPNLEALKGFSQSQNKPQGFAEHKGGVVWTKDEIETLKMLVQAHTPVDEISDELGKSEDAIEAKAKELKLTLA
jgi:hypothetical protein